MQIIVKPYQWKTYCQVVPIGELCGQAAAERLVAKPWQRETARVQQMETETSRGSGAIR